MSHERTPSSRQHWKLQPISIAPIFGSLDARTWAITIGVAMSAIGVSLLTAHNTGGVLASGLALVAIAIAIIDARHFIIPDELNIAGLALGLAYAGFPASRRWKLSRWRCCEVWCLHSSFSLYEQRTGGFAGVRELG